ncbi:MAG: methyltransferase domain-containing protein [Methanoregula sp.]|nr:methyltransferase domain-containing protein [Methanoregula sp.]
MTGWSEIWKNRSCNSADPSHTLTLEDLLLADGYDTDTGRVSISDFQKYIHSISQTCGIQPGESLFDVGMGAGAFLFPWYLDGHPVGGLDYSAPLISLALRIMPGATKEFVVCDASHMDTGKKYDIVLSSGVFLYFPDHHYARTVVEKMISKSQKTIAILDIPDMAQREITEKFRHASLPPGEYEERYRGLDHLYFARSWFHEIADASGLEISVSDQHIPHYANGRFRFNVVMKK